MALAEETPFSNEAAEEQLAEVREQIDKGGFRFPGMTFEDGVAAALTWVLGDTDEIPYPES